MDAKSPQTARRPEIGATIVIAAILAGKAGATSLGGDGA